MVKVMKVCITSMVCLVKEKEWNVEWLKRSNPAPYDDLATEIMPGSELTKRLYVSKVEYIQNKEER